MKKIGGKKFDLKFLIKANKNLVYTFAPSPPLVGKRSSILGLRGFNTIYIGKKSLQIYIYQFFLLSL